MEKYSTICLLIVGIHAGSVIHSMTKKMWVDTIVNLGFEGHFEAHKVKMEYIFFYVFVKKIMTPTNLSLDVYSNF